MAYEAFAGGTISGGAEATAFSLRPRGGYVPVADIPNAPKLVDMPMVEYPRPPSIRYGTLSPETIDMESRAAKLQQKELPSSFEEAGAIRARVAGQGQMAIGKAIESGGEEISKALASAGNVLAKIAHKGLEDKDNAAEHEWNLHYTAYRGRLAQIYATEKPENWRASVDAARDDFRAATSNLGVFPGTQENLRSKTEGAVISSGYELGTELGKRNSTDAAKLGLSMIEDGRKMHDQKMADEGVSLLHKNGVYTDEQAKHEYEVTDTYQKISNMEAAISNTDNPQAAAELANDAKAVTEGGKAKTFTVLNSHPGLAPNALVKAQEAVRAAKQRGQAEYEQKLHNGEIKDEKDIAEIGKRSLWTSDQIEAMQKIYKQAHIPYTPGEHVRVRNDIAAFDRYDDPTGEKQFKIWQDIEQNIDEPHRAHFRTMLQNKIDKADEPATATKNAHKAILDEIKKKDETGVLVPKGEMADLLNARAKLKDRQKEIDAHPGQAARILARPQWQLTAGEAAALKHNDDLALQLQNTADNYLEKNPSATYDDFRKEVFPDGGEANSNTEGNLRSPEVRRGTAVDISKTSAAPTKADLDARSRIPTSTFLNPLPQNFTPHLATLNSSLGGVLGGKANLFVEAGQRWGVDPLLLMAIAQFETGNGTSDMARNMNNIGGTTVPGGAYAKYPNVAASIDAMARNLKENYLNQGLVTIEQIASKYAEVGAANDPNRTNAEWPGAVSRNYQKLRDQVGEPLRTGAGYQQGPVGQVHPQLLAMVNQLERNFGPLPIKSGYRSPRENITAGGASDSEHLRGDAVDIDTSRMSSAQKLSLLYAAYRVGVRGFGIYTNNLHFDLGLKHGQRAWGGGSGASHYTSAAIPGWAREFGNMINA